jgi:hypothetical protein
MGSGLEKAIIVADAFGAARSNLAKRRIKPACKRGVNASRRTRRYCLPFARSWMPRVNRRITDLVNQVARTAGWS